MKRDTAMLVAAVLLLISVCAGMCSSSYIRWPGGDVSAVHIAAEAIRLGADMYLTHYIMAAALLMALGIQI
ncbi:MAG TPA: hypothetical protein H9689_06960 [Firmicutes bacterium]|nr:hypothetical protein [Bacillota bacterium]